MLNKKSQAPGEYLGIIIFVFVLAFTFIFLSSCSIFKVNQDIKQFEFSKTEIGAIRAINFFLEMDYVDPNDPEFQDDKEKKVQDIILKKYRDVDFPDGDLFDKLVDDYFSEVFDDKWRLVIYPGIGNRGSTYDYQSSGFRYDDRVEASITVLVPNEDDYKYLEDDDYEYLEVVLQVFE